MMSISRSNLNFTIIVPDEILCFVFSLVQLNDPIPASRYGSLYLAKPTGHKYGWVKITHVNRRWRQVAIGNATLWTSFTGKLGSRWFKEFVLRSKSALLTVDDGEFPDSVIYYSYKPASERFEIRKTMLLGVLTEHRGRIASLRLHDPKHDVVGLAFNSALPRLKEVYLEGNDRHTPYLVGELLGHAPHLRRLHLNLPHFPFSCLDWTHPIWNGLTALNLMFKARAGGILTPAFLDAIRRMHSLRELAIHEHDVRPSPVSCDYRCSGAPSDLIVLPCLDSIILETRVETHAHFLRHIRPPSHARLYLSPHERIGFSSPDAHVNAPVYQELARALDKVLDFQAQAFQAAHMTFTATLRDTVLLGLSHVAQPSKPLPGFFLRSTERPHELNVNNLTLCYHDIRSSIILPVLSSSTIHTLTLENVVTSQLTEICFFFPNVERLRLSVIPTVPRHDIRFLEDSTLLPMLRFVDMDASFFNLRTILNCYSPQGARVVPERLNALEDTLQARWEMGSPLQVLFHVEEEVALVKDGRVEETSCRGIGEDVVRESVERLESVEGVLLVGRYFDPFAM